MAPANVPFYPLRSGGWFVILVVSLHSVPSLIILPSGHTTTAIASLSVVPIPILISTPIPAATNVHTVRTLIPILVVHTVLTLIVVSILTIVALIDTEMSILIRLV